MFEVHSRHPCRPAIFNLLSYFRDSHLSLHARPHDEIHFHHPFTCGPAWHNLLAYLNDPPLSLNARPPWCVRSITHWHMVCGIHFHHPFTCGSAWHNLLSYLSDSHLSLHAKPHGVWGTLLPSMKHKKLTSISQWSPLVPPCQTTWCVRYTPAIHVIPHKALYVAQIFTITGRFKHQ